MQKVLKSLIILGTLAITTANLNAQVTTQPPQVAQPVPDTSFKPHGTLWGYAFGDYYYKAHADAQSRGGSNQYTGIEQGRNAFQFRRIYLGYNYDISRKFSAEMLLAAEDTVTTSSATTSGDLLADNKLTYYIKLADLRWKNIWKGTD